MQLAGIKPLRLLLAWLFACAIPTSSIRQPVELSAVTPTPPMGYDAWNAVGCRAGETLIRQSAEAMVRSGMRAAGYRYVIIDDCWQAPERDRAGNLRPNPHRFPHGLRALATYVHRLGLKLGIYEDAGRRTCAGYPGSYGHEQRDATTFASWGLDYVKEDWCAVPYGDFPGETRDEVARTLYTRMAKALVATRRPMVLALCTGIDESVHPWAWAVPVGNLWRTTPDVVDRWSSILAILDRTLSLARRERPGRWNDLDMLEVGNGGMTAAEDRAQFSLWSLMESPLIASTDLRSASSVTKEILTDREVIAVDSDPLRAEGKVVLRTGNREVLVKPLTGGDRAAVLLNRGARGTTISVRAAALGLRPAPRYTVRNLWTHSSHAVGSTIAAFVPAASVVMLRIGSPASH